MTRVFALNSASQIFFFNLRFALSLFNQILHLAYGLFGPGLGVVLLFALCLAHNFQEIHPYLFDNFLTLIF